MNEVMFLLSIHVLGMVASFVLTWQYYKEQGWMTLGELFGSTMAIISPIINWLLPFVWVCEHIDLDKTIWKAKQ